MDSSRVRVENGIVVGNVEAKTKTKNPIARYLVNGFDACFRELLTVAGPGTITEVGCGEGHLVQLALAETSASILATELSPSVLAQAGAAIDDPRAEFESVSIYDIPETGRYRADLVVCCEVLEHLEDPEAGLRKLHALAAPHCLVSVPREPLWRGLNMARGSYLGALGNTPGHLQHWSRSSFLRFLESRFFVREVRTPLPWTMALCSKM